MTELCSYFGLISVAALSICWAFVTVALLILYELGQPVSLELKIDNSKTILLFTALLVLLFLVILAIGFVARPNNWDSMTYHMPRVMHWEQNGSIDFYPTTIIRQLASGPFAEMIILHFDLLGGGDYYANAVQCLAFAGSAVAASLLAKRLGAPAMWQVAAAVFVSTLPMGILQASTTQNDIVVSYFLISAADRLLVWTNSSRIRDVAATGIAFGLAILTKGTAYFFAAPLLVLMAFCLIYKRRLRKLGELTAIGLLILVCNSGQYVRNFVSFGSPFGTQGAITAVEPNVQTLLSNIARDTGANFATPWPNVNAVIVQSLNNALKRVGLDPNPPNATWPNSHFTLSQSVFHEDFAPNPLHTLIILFSMLLWSGRALLWGGTNVWHVFVKREDAGARRLFQSGLDRCRSLYPLEIILGACIFAFLLRWQPWITRLEMPFFVLMAPAVASVLPRKLNGPIVFVLFCTISFVSAIPVLLFNERRPLVGDRSIFTVSQYETMFTQQPDFGRAYEEAMAAVRATDATELGMIAGSDTWEYPAWRLLNGDRQRPPVRIGQICVPSIAGLKQMPGFAPRVAVLLDRDAVKTLSCLEGTFQRGASFGEGRNQMFIYHRVGN